MFNTFTDYENAGVVFPFGGFSLGVSIVVLVAMVLFVAFFVRMVLHENQAYRAIIEHRTPEAGPAAEGEPPVY